MKTKPFNSPLYNLKNVIDVVKHNRAIMDGIDNKSVMDNIEDIKEIYRKNEKININQNNENNSFYIIILFKSKNDNKINLEIIDNSNRSYYKEKIIYIKKIIKIILIIMIKMVILL